MLDPGSQDGVYGVDILGYVMGYSRRPTPVVTTRTGVELVGI
jgi:hypothetical protein